MPRTMNVNRTPSTSGARDPMPADPEPRRRRVARVVKPQTPPAATIATQPAAAVPVAATASAAAAASASDAGVAAPSDQSWRGLPPNDKLTGPNQEGVMLFTYRPVPRRVREDVPRAAKGHRPVAEPADSNDKRPLLYALRQMALDDEFGDGAWCESCGAAFSETLERSPQFFPEQRTYRCSACKHEIRWTRGHRMECVIDQEDWAYIGAGGKRIPGVIKCREVDQ